MAPLARATKIVATLGPASTDPQRIDELVQAGVDVFRLNFSHGRAADHQERAQVVRAAGERHGRELAILVDLQGPKIRVGRFAKGSVTLESGARFRFDTHETLGDEARVGLDYPELVHDVSVGDVLLLNDGLISMQVEAVGRDFVDCKVMEGGVLSDRKGINRQGGGLTAPALTDKDKSDLIVAAEIEADFLAVSFPKNAADIHEARALLKAAGGHGLIIAKIERVEAIENLAEIIEASNGIMVARGDLAVEVGEAAVPALQKRMIRMAREANRLTITATQMMESMISSPVPTRAEVSDVANAVLDGTDAVMLSAETATGSYPVRTVQTMVRICAEAEKSYEPTLDTFFLNRTFTRIDQSVAMAALFTARHLKVRAIVALTESGATALWISRLNAGVPIYALSQSVRSRRRMALYRDVAPLAIDNEGQTRESLMHRAERNLLDAGVVTPGDFLVITVGEPVGQPGGTNTMKIVRVGS